MGIHIGNQRLTREQVLGVTPQVEEKPDPPKKAKKRKLKSTGNTITVEDEDAS